MLRIKSFAVCFWIAILCLIKPVSAFSQSESISRPDSISLTDTMSLQLTYRVGLGHAELATANAKWVFDDDKFEVVATSQTVGLTDMFRKYRGRTELVGRVEKGRYLPDRLLIEGVSKKRTRAALSLWTPDASLVDTQREPALDLEKVFPLADKHITGAIDPFSAMLNALDDISQNGSCTRSERIYDGLRTSVITLYDLGADYLEKDRPFAFEGKVFKCGFLGKPTGGHQRKSRWRKEQPKPDDVLIFIAEVRPDLFLPVRMEAKSFLGTLTIRLAMPSLKVDEMRN